MLYRCSRQRIARESLVNTTQRWIDNEYFRISNYALCMFQKCDLKVAYCCTEAMPRRTSVQVANKSVRYIIYFVVLRIESVRTILALQLSLRYLEQQRTRYLLYLMYALRSNPSNLPKSLSHSDSTDCQIQKRSAGKLLSQTCILIDACWLDTGHRKSVKDARFLDRRGSPPCHFFTCLRLIEASFIHSLPEEDEVKPLQSYIATSCVKFNHEIVER